MDGSVLVEKWVDIHMFLSVIVIMMLIIMIMRSIAGRPIEYYQSYSKSSLIGSITFDNTDDYYYT